ncbi:hypothetical protein DMA11_10420 [Marinilabiliaceae bacterium JC017]|nr:hypothetical protein DMA11_10420 [Marinilabiliaceae bacterium JC017]
MLKLYINNRLATLPDKCRIPLKIKNPAFNKAGTFSYTFRLPKETNRAILQHADEEDNLQVITHKFQLWLGSEKFMEGECVIKNTASAFECYLKSGKSSVASVLKESYLDEQINGQEWGQNPDGLTGLNTSVQSAFPGCNFVVAPIKTDKKIINEWDPNSNVLASTKEDDVTPFVYIRYLINRITQGLGLLKTRDDFSLYNDFNRLCLISPRIEIYKDKFTFYKHWMPHITAADLVNDLRDRFNIVAFFNPLMNEVEYVNFDAVFSAPVIDWTNKFIRDEDIPAKEEGGVNFENDGEDEDMLSPEKIEESYELVTVPTYSGIKEATGHTFKVTDINRYFKRQTEESDSDMTKVRYVDTGAFLTHYYNLIDNPDDATDVRSSISPAAGVEALVAKFIFDEQEGKLKDNVSVYNVELKADQSGDVELQVKVSLWNRKTSTIEHVLGEKTQTINHTDYRLYDFIVDINESLAWSHYLNKNGDYLSGTYLVVEFKSYHPTAARSVSMRFGYVESVPVPVMPYTLVIADNHKIRVSEMGAIGNYTKGSAEKPQEYKPKSKIPFNTTDRCSGFAFQMPDVDPEAKKQQKDFAYSIYRGMITDEVKGEKNAPYCNFDSLDMNMGYYQSRLTYGDTPDLSLRWHGSDGLIQKLWQKTVAWILHTRRPVRKVFQLSVHDLLQVKMWYRIQVDNQFYLVNTISVSVDEKSQLAESTVDMYTL